MDLYCDEEIDWDQYEEDITETARSILPKVSLFNLSLQRFRVVDLGLKVVLQMAITA